MATGTTRSHLGEELIDFLIYGRALRFTYPAAFGDLLAAVLALIAIPAVAARAKIAKLPVWLFNIEGTLDLMAAIVLATVYDAAPFMGPAYWIPALWVPALLVTHYITFVLLFKKWPSRHDEPHQWEGRRR